MPRLRKNSYYALTIEGNTYIRKYIGYTLFGYCFSQDPTQAATYFGKNRLIAANPLPCRKP